MELWDVDIFLISIFILIVTVSRNLRTWILWVKPLHRTVRFYIWKNMQKKIIFSSMNFSLASLTFFIFFLVFFHLKTFKPMIIGCIGCERSDTENRVATLMNSFQKLALQTIWNKGFHMFKWINKKRNQPNHTVTTCASFAKRYYTDLMFASQPVKIIENMKTVNGLACTLHTFNNNNWANKKSRRHSFNWFIKWWCMLWIGFNVKIVGIPSLLCFSLLVFST